MTEKWEEELEELLRSKKVEPTEDLLEFEEPIGSETTDHEPDEAVVDYIVSAAQKKAQEGAGKFSFGLGENLFQILEERCMSILLNVMRRTRLCIIFRHQERRLEFIKVW